MPPRTASPLLSEAIKKSGAIWKLAESYETKISSMWTLAAGCSEAPKTIPSESRSEGGGE